MNNLSFNWNILIFFNFSLFSNILNLFFWNILWDILSQIFNSIIISNCNFSWYLFNSYLLSVLCYFSCFWNSLYSCIVLVLYNFLLEWNVLNSAFTFYDLFTGVYCCVYNLGLMLMLSCCSLISSSSSTNIASITTISSSIGGCAIYRSRT